MAEPCRHAPWPGYDLPTGGPWRGPIFVHLSRYIYICIYIHIHMYIYIEATITRRGEKEATIQGLWFGPVRGEERKEQDNGSYIFLEFRV